MEKIILFLTVLTCTISGCSKEKTDYESENKDIVTEHLEFKEVSSIKNGQYYLQLEALGGVLFKGYNRVRLKVVSKNTPVDLKYVLFNPIQTDENGNTIACPHSNKLVFNPTSVYWDGYVVFTEESNIQSSWKIDVTIPDMDSQRNIQFDIKVQKQNNKNLNMTSFSGIDKKQYILALIAPQKPKVAENRLTAALYELDPNTGTYSKAINYTLALDPRMPESSMGNHSSPNNQDLLQDSDKFYRGVVNYTMTGNWTLNFILYNDKGRIIKGTKVPDDFTPGVEGIKSELHIDILF